MKGNIMGCFSYLCKKCGESIKINGDCVLFYIVNGEVQEKLSVKYTGYGTVIDNNDDELLWFTNIDNIQDLHFSENNNSGFAAYHDYCFNEKYLEKPLTKSKDDINQGCDFKDKSFEDYYHY